GNPTNFTKTTIRNNYAVDGLGRVTGYKEKTDENTNPGNYNTINNDNNFLYCSHFFLLFTIR
ncbi:MAG: hypothetical protein NTY95_18990, partial [Bacteroidia bacterium]|nr:hypothetical protein [Bacteroidia bacterium]